MGNTARGLYRKFIPIIRADGQSGVGKKHFGCQYFVLDLTHDPYALHAIEAYSRSCQGEYPLLASDLMEIVERS